MTIPELAQALAEALAPALPYLLAAGEKGAEAAGKKLGEDAWRGAKGLWGKLRGRVEERPAAKEAAEDVVAASEGGEEHEEAVLALRRQLRKILEADESLAREVEGLLPASLAVVQKVAGGGGAAAASPGATVAGAGGGAVGGSVGGAFIVAREGSRVEVGAPAPVSAGASPEVLRANYLHRLFHLNQHLTLAAFDPTVGEARAEARLNLAGVYTGLLTLTPAREDRPKKEGHLPGPDPRQHRRSALELLDEERHLVLTGDPGSGKSTFVQFVALCLAGEGLGHPVVNLARLRVPLPEEEAAAGRGREETPQPWRHGALLPVLVVLRELVARGNLDPGEEGTARHLWEFIDEQLQRAGLGDYQQALRRELQERGGLLLLDGLDEVPEADARRVQIRQVVSDFAAGHPRCRVLLTSRSYAYQSQRWRLPGFEEAVLAPFHRGQIRHFVRGWYGEIAALGRLGEEDARGRAALLERAIFGNDRLQALAERPLLLALMASLHAWRGGSLPEQRERLYADTVELLLDFWERRRLRREEGGEMAVVEPSIAEWLEVDQRKLRQALDELAFEAHRSQPEAVGTADLPEGEVVSRLMGLAERPGANPTELVRYLSQRAGLLVPRGVKVYTFPHRTLQEYLAACHLTEKAFPRLLAELARGEPERWREVALLAAAKAARGTPASIWYLVEALCHREPVAGVAAEDVWGAHLAAQAVAEAADLAQVEEWDRSKLERLRRWLLHILEAGALPALERARAGDSLATLGDPRFDPERWSLPPDSLLGFVEVPAGPFHMGSDPTKDGESFKDETPLHEVMLPTFYMARHAVTVAQFRAFVEASGHELKERWSLQGLPHQPVGAVTWYEALGYCRWLGERLREVARARQGEAGPGGAEEAFWKGLAGGSLAVTLPSEAEWEKAARGTDGRIFPWGDEGDPELANYGDTGLGRPTAVGCFPGGVSPYGCADMAGNVWEWTRSVDRPYPYDAVDGREALEASSQRLRVLRGGSFIYSQRSARCAYRYRNLPGSRDGYFGFRVVVSPFTSGL